MFLNLPFLLNLISLSQVCRGCIFPILFCRKIDPGLGLEHILYLLILFSEEFNGIKNCFPYVLVLICELPCLTLLYLENQMRLSVSCFLQYCFTVCPKCLTCSYTFASNSE